MKINGSKKGLEFSMMISETHELKPGFGQRVPSLNPKLDGKLTPFFRKHLAPFYWKVGRYVYMYTIYRINICK